MFDIDNEIARLIFDNSDLGIIYADISGKILLWNTWMSHRTGLSSDAVKGIHIKDVLVNIPKAFFDALDYAYKNCMPRVLSPVFHMSNLSNDVPAKQFIKILPVLNATGDIQGMLIIIEDITSNIDYEEEIEKRSRHLRILEEKARQDEKDALNWLKEQLDFNNALSNNLGEGIIVFNRAGIITSTNPATEKVLGWRNTELFGIHIKNIMSDSSKALNVFKNGEVIKSYDDFFKRKDGSYIPVSYVASPIILNEKIKSVIITFLDISEKKAIENRLKEEYKKTKKVLADLVNTLSYTAEIRDPYTAGHQRRVTRIALLIVEEMGLNKDVKDTVNIAGILHDIGKIAIPAEILSKPGKLNDYELQLIKGHSRIGYEILKDIEFEHPISKIVLEHHERLDGSGYPDGLRGDEILLEARIIGVADVVEAMASHRPYRPALGIDAALEEIEKNAGILYEKAVVNACFKIFREKGFALE
ncbi:MAG: PAS domain S-box protein [Syntrophorhabdaceae bacterium]|nr:PAS domain S-box protein [Syntrophorhabdaceae bacterium]